MATHSSVLAWRIPMERGAWQATVHWVAKSHTRLSDFNSLHFLRGSVVKNSPASAGDTSSIPELGKSPGKGPTGVNPLQYSCLGNLMDRGGLQVTSHGVT